MKPVAQSGTRAVALALILVGSACADASTGSPTDGGPSAAEDGGSTNVTVVQGAVTANAYLRGDDIVIAVESSAPLYMLTCADRTKLQKRVGDEWQPLRNDAPVDFHNGYYFDDAYVRPTVGLGCDVQSCQAANGGANAGPAIEVIATGDTRPAPAWVVSDRLADPAPVFVTEPVSGPVRAQFSFFTDATCSTHETISLDLEIPEEGVCCPVGSAGCGSSGPVGGWAATLATCDDSAFAATDHSELVTDNRGCPVLRTTYGSAENPDIAACQR